MKTREEIIADINTKMAEEFEIEESSIHPDGNIFETLDLDSLSLIDVVSIVKTSYGVNIPGEQLSSIKTFNDLYDYIEQHMEA